MNHRFASLRFPYLPIELTVGDHELVFEALLDTGFDGYAAIPVDMMRGLAPRGVSLWSLADGTVVQVPYFRGMARAGRFDPFPITIIALGDEPLVGRGVIDHFTIILDHGRQVIVEP